MRACLSLLANALTSISAWMCVCWGVGQTRAPDGTAGCLNEGRRATHVDPTLGVSRRITKKRMCTETMSTMRGAAKSAVTCAVKIAWTIRGKCQRKAQNNETRSDHDMFTHVHTKSVNNSPCLASKRSSASIPWKETRTRDVTQPT